MEKKQSISVPSVARGLLENEALTAQDKVLVIAILAFGAGFIGEKDVPKPTKNIPEFLCNVIKNEQSLMFRMSADRQERRRNMSNKPNGQSADSPRTVQSLARVVNNGNGNGNGNGININTPIPPKGVVSADVSVNVLDDFAVFYEAYPRHGNKPYALEQWRDAEASGELPPIGELLEALEAWKRSERWTEDGARYIPAAGNWLKGRMWNDPPGGVPEKKAAAPTDPSLPFAPTPEDLLDEKSREVFFASPAWRERVVAWCRETGRDWWLEGRA